MKDFEKRTVDVPIEIIEEIKQNEETLIFRIVPEKDTVYKLKKLLEVENELHFNIAFFVTLEGIKSFESGETDSIGMILINEKLTEED